MGFTLLGVAPVAVPSLSGAGTLASEGVLNQNGGLNVTDTEGDGISLTSNSFAALETTVPEAEVGMAAGGFGSVAIGNAFNQNYALAAGPASLPLTVVTDVNDTFVWTPIATGIPETFTMAAGGPYTTIAELVTAMGAAVGERTEHFVPSIANLYGDETLGALWVTEFGDAPGDTLSAGATNVLAATGFASPTTLALRVSDVLAYFSATGAQLQAVTGQLSIATLGNLQTVLQSLIAALSATGYGLIVNSTT